MGPEELLHLHDAGFEIGSHSMTHPMLPQIPRNQAWEEILHSRMKLEGILNGSVRSFAYPYGQYNTTLKTLVKEAGYDFACTCWSGGGKPLVDPYAIRRIEVSDSVDPVQFGLKVRGPFPVVQTAMGRKMVVSVHPSQGRTLLLVSGGLNWPTLDEMKRREAADQMPRRSIILSGLQADVVDENFLASAPAFRRFLYRLLPLSASQILETCIVGGRYDVIVSWAEHLGIPFATLLMLSGTRFPHVGIFSWISRPKKAILLRFARSRFNRIVLMSSRQREFAIRNIGLPPERIAFLRWPVDHKFWRPSNRQADTICAVGREMRDYATLVEALRGTGIPCHIAAGGQASRRKKDPWVRTLSRTETLPPNVTVGPKSFVELRDLYQRSLFVVMPLLPTKTDNGTTTILEAMSTGRAVICSKVEGQRDVIREGETGLLVPPEDPAALRRAIEYLWKNPAEAERMGEAARKYVEAHHALDGWAEAVRGVVQESIVEHVPGFRPGWIGAPDVP
jgi:glycosyltransferase involved in cell wall biosynthesis